MLRGTLQKRTTGIGGQPIELWMKAGASPWYKAGITATSTDFPGFVSFYVWTTDPAAHTVQHYVLYSGTSTVAAAKSNVVAIKYENTPTKPYQTTLYAYAPKPVVPKGTLNQMWVKLSNGNTPLTNHYVFVWKWSGGKFVIVSRVITRTAAQSPGAGWALADYRWNSVGTGMYKFFYGTSPSGATSYARSESNAVQMIWT